MKLEEQCLFKTRRVAGVKESAWPFFQLISLNKPEKDEKIKNTHNS